jgi:long-chain-alcohol oxidase
MGSCRMGADRRHSVVDCRGESWDAEGLWIADASVFPTASGVNPMVTVEALSLCIAETLASELLDQPHELLPASNVGPFEW